MKKVFIVFIVILAVACGYYFLNQKIEVASLPEEALGTNPDFVWHYSQFMDGEYPKTHITLTATFDNGQEVTKDIDTVDGSCNDYSSPDQDVYARSKMIICYASGLGHYFKVVEKDSGFVVLKKTFEEASPDYNPPVENFEPIVRF